ncbi:MAG: (E)-4-hydroxy-3-methylbut-2-enyl-diphosphate synthase [Opitutales bacterium]|jgi:(E)-4-hydroxy-3-methylbut-2-enyl-diphosphate synthase
MSGINDFPGSYARSRFVSLRRESRAVSIGSLRVGGGSPVAVQSMTNTNTLDPRGTVRQCVALAEAGCHIVRVTAPNIAAARVLAEIRSEFSDAGYWNVPLVADIHFLPAAAMEAALHVEKVRINPGNYADRKLTEARAYTDAEYAEQLERLHDAVSPLVLRCKELGRAIRVGVNHGSLSDRVMNRYGDSPAGMCESAMEFLRICEDHGFRDIVVSMKASNPKVMIEATRMMAARMDAEGLNYPLHLGVTEAGGGEDARVKSALGIGTMLRDGLGDTIRVSLTEDPVAEVPVALALAREAVKTWAAADNADLRRHAEHQIDSIDPYSYRRRESLPVRLGPDVVAGAGGLPRVVLRSKHGPSGAAKTLAALKAWHKKAPKMRAEALILPISSTEEAAAMPAALDMLACEAPYVFAELSSSDKMPLSQLLTALPESLNGDSFALLCSPENSAELEDAMERAETLSCALALDLAPAALTNLLPALEKADQNRLIFTTSRPFPPLHPAGQYRMLAETLLRAGIKSPLWIRHTTAIFDDLHGGDPADDATLMMDAAILIGGLLCDGLGDMVSVESCASMERGAEIAYGILQGSRTRSTRTEYVACPSCGRTLFDLESTTGRVRAATGHLEGVTIAVMGCIVNGPGEMADADFGYVGGAPGRINLYVGKKPVQFNIPSDEAVERLVELVKARGKWQEP